MADHHTLADLTRRLVEFRDARDWRRFHSLKDLIVSLNLEAAELLELTQWQPAPDFEAAAQGKTALKEARRAWLLSLVGTLLKGGLPDAEIQLLKSPRSSG